MKRDFFDIDLAFAKALSEHLSNFKEASSYIPFKEALSGVLAGVILFDEHEELVYLNSKAASMVRKMAKTASHAEAISKEIAFIKKFMVEARREFPQQNWLNESTIFVDCLTVFQVYARWIQGDSASNSYLLLKMEDQNQLSQDMALEEAKRIGLTLREREVWLLHRANYTYKKIAEKLNITPNTVKKHMKSIFVKSRSASS
jgi:DNA-binding CsgD family transcriptional regulator